MTSPDPFVYDDAAYVLGALSAEERAAFEAHLRSCPACNDRVADARAAADLLEGITAADVTPDPDAVSAPMPDTLLPGLLRRARSRRRRWIGAAVTSLVAAAAVVAGVMLASSGSSPGVPQRAMVAVAASPVRATVALTAESWGTKIDLHCRYAPGDSVEHVPYDLVAYGRDGHRYVLGSWSLSEGQDIDYSTGTWLPPGRIARLEVTLPDGTALLRLTT